MFHIDFPLYMSNLYANQYDILIVANEHKKYWVHGGIFLPLHVNMQEKYVYMQDNYIYMQVTNLQIEPDFIWVKSITYTRIWYHKCKMQHDYNNKRPIYVNMQDNYINMRDNYVNMRDNYADMRLIYANLLFD